MSCLRAAHTTASMGVFTSRRSQMARNRRLSVRALNSSLRAATSAVTPLAIWASNLRSSSHSRGSSVPRRMSVACSTPSSLVRGDDRGDAADGCIRPGAPLVRGRPSSRCSWPMSAGVSFAGRSGGTPSNDSLVDSSGGEAPRAVDDSPREDGPPGPVSDRRNTPAAPGGKASCPGWVMIAAPFTHPFTSVAHLIRGLDVNRFKLRFGPER
ncbi:MAG: hypothetical protein JWN52_3750 [Actinomycetia bacterium]|jgi:hypothetical protein|nr:hypothetical protein [Actinomycetes bacterium]